jgi:hypothetical protein
VIHRFFRIALRNRYFFAVVEEWVLVEMAGNCLTQNWFKMAIFNWFWVLNDPFSMLGNLYLKRTFSLFSAKFALEIDKKLHRKFTENTLENMHLYSKFAYLKIYLINFQAKIFSEFQSNHLRILKIRMRVREKTGPTKSSHLLPIYKYT